MTAGEENYMWTKDATHRWNDSERLKMISMSLSLSRIRTVSRGGQGVERSWLGCTSWKVSATHSILSTLRLGRCDAHSFWGSENTGTKCSSLPETSADPSLQAKQLQLKKARLADDLNDKISHQPGPVELIHKNILPIYSSIKQVITGKPGFRFTPFVI